MGILRLLLASVVMLSHYDVLELSLATIAVCCFYIISGFYMQLLLAPENVNVGHFYISRAFRIYPLYWVLTAISFFAQPLSDLWHVPDHLVVKMLYIVNSVTLFGHDFLTLLQYDPAKHSFSPLLVYGSPVPGNWVGYNLTVLGQAWSLSVELLFYAMAPFLLKLRTSYLSALLLCSASIKAYIVSFGIYDTFWIDAFYPAELTFFILGALGFRVYNSRFSGDRHTRLSMVISGLAASGAVCLLAGWGKNTAFITGHWFTIYFATTGLTALILPFLFNASRRNALDRWLGNLSYPMYLSHLAVVEVLHGRLHIDNLPVIMAMTVLVSISGYWFIDRPVDRFRHRMFPVAMAAGRV